MPLSALASALVGVGVEYITGSAEIAVQLAEAYETTQNAILFVNSLMKANPGLTRSQAGEWYRTARYWADQGRVLRQLDPATVLARELARVTRKATETIGLTAQYRYQVEIIIQFPLTGDVRRFGYFVESSTLLTPRQATGMAISGLAESFEGKSAPGMLGENEGEVLSASVTGFTRFEA